MADSEETLPGGLVLRTVRSADLEQVEELLSERGEPVDADDFRLMVEDPDYGLDACAVVVDGDRVVSTLFLLDEELTLGRPGVTLPAGQVDLVATDVAYEGRGLVRALMNWAHRRSTARGHLVQVMLGIPYFYRRFGYSYSIDIAQPYEVAEPPPPEPGYSVRVAENADIDAMAAMQDRTQDRVDLRMPHSPACWRWLVAAKGSTTWIVEHAGRPVATGRTTPPEDGLELTEVAADDEGAARALLSHAARMAATAETPMRVTRRPGTPLGDLLERTATPPQPLLAEQYYVRIPDPVILLERLRPVLQTRADGAALDLGDDVTVSLFSTHVRFPVVEGKLGPAAGGGQLQSPGSVSGAGVAPDRLADVLFGPLGIEAMSAIHPDVYPGRRAELFSALFPPVTSDLLTYYIP